MNRLLISTLATAAVGLATSLASASPALETFSLNTLDGMTAPRIVPSDTMMAQCYGGRGYSYGQAPMYRRVYRQTPAYYYPPRRGGVSIGIGTGYRGYGPSYNRGYGGGYNRGGYGRGANFGRSGFGLYINL